MFATFIITIIILIYAITIPASSVWIDVGMVSTWVMASYSSYWVYTRMRERDKHKDWKLEMQKRKGNKT